MPVTILQKKMKRFTYFSHILLVSIEKANKPEHNSHSHCDKYCTIPGEDKRKLYLTTMPTFCQTASTTLLLRFWKIEKKKKKEEM